MVPAGSFSCPPRHILISAKPNGTGAGSSRSTPLKDPVSVSSAPKSASHGMLLKLRMEPFHGLPAWVPQFFQQN